MVAQVERIGQTSMLNRPNIVIVTLHDAGRQFGCYGQRVHSPNVDRFAEEGVKFERAFSAAPVCSPARGAMMTGRYPQTNGLMGLTHGPWWWRLHDDERHLAQLLLERGYHTRQLGFQHEADDPERLGFETHIPLDKEDGGRRDALEVAELFEQALPVMRRDDRPFYAQIGFFETHTPFNDGRIVPDDPDRVEVPGFIEDTPEARRYIADLNGAIRRADEAFGRIRAALNQENLAENTLVVFTVDHGVEYNRRAKWTCYDPGIEAALLMRWPGGGLLGGRTVPGVVSTVDVAPTVLDLLDGEVPAFMQGVSLAPVARGDTDRSPHDAVYSMFVNAPEHRAVRTERYKLLRSFGASRMPPTPTRIDGPAASRHTTPFMQLFDLEKDPCESNNVAGHADYAAVREALDEKLYQWLRDVGDPILHGPVRSPYYDMAMATMPRP